jgi:hypothetical protein
MAFKTSLSPRATIVKVPFFLVKLICLLRVSFSLKKVVEII